MKVPEDAVWEILLRLPVRSLLRFRCVCKDWCALIKSFFFKDRYLALRRVRARAGVDEFIVVNHTFESDDENYDCKNFVTCCNGDYESLALSVSAASSKDFDISGYHSDPMYFINHVNGIVCVAGFGFNKRVTVALLNPFLREVKKLPYIEFEWFTDGIPHPGLECFTDGIGLGYDDATNEYKVVAILTLLFPDDIKQIALVYRLSTDSWTILGDMSIRYISICKLRSIFSNGSVHWIIGIEPNYRILTFNTTNELFQVIHFPRGWNDHDDEARPHLLTVDESTIALVAHTHPSANETCGQQQVLDVWVMKEYGVEESWTKQYSVRPLPLIWKPLSFWRKDHLLLETDSGELIYYNLVLLEGQPGQSDPICVPESEEWSVELLTCNESFVSIK